MKGLICEVFTAKAFPDCSNHGISSQVSSVTLTFDEDMPGGFEPNESRPEVKLDRSRREGDPSFWRIVPVDVSEGKWLMFGGAFVYTSDARFPSHAPIKLHDRME